MSRVVRALAWRIRACTVLMSAPEAIKSDARPQKTESFVQTRVAGPGVASGWPGPKKRTPKTEPEPVRKKLGLALGRDGRNS